MGNNTHKKANNPSISSKDDSNISPSVSSQTIPSQESLSPNPPSIDPSTNSISNDDNAVSGDFTHSRQKSRLKKSRSKEEYFDSPPIKICDSDDLSYPSFCDSLDSKDFHTQKKNFVQPDQLDLNLNNLSNLKNNGFSILKPLQDLSHEPSTPQNDYELHYSYTDRTAVKIRSDFFSKLICKRVWMPSSQHKTHNTLIIFDWDDTLLCTSYLSPLGEFDENRELNDNEKIIFSQLEISVLRLLKFALEKGNVYIITNAEPNWVEFSAQKFYPSIIPLLSKIKIISARGKYQNRYPENPNKWKTKAFLNLAKSFDLNLVTNIVCLGDSNIEMKAGMVLASKFNCPYIKKVKFIENPTPEELNKELMLVIDQFLTIYSATKSSTIKVMVDKKKKKEKI